MMSTHLVTDTPAFHLVRTLLFLAGTLLLALALLMNELFLSVFTLYPDRVASIRLGQVFLGGAGLMMMLASELVRRVGWINRFAGKRFVGRLTLALMSIAVPIYIRASVTAVRDRSKLGGAVTELDIVARDLAIHRAAPRGVVAHPRLEHVLSPQERTPQHDQENEETRAHSARV